MTDATIQDQAAEEPGQWEFIGRAPTGAEVRALLEGLPTLWGIDTVDYLDYVQALPQNKKIKRQHPGTKSLVTETIEVHILYMSVAGRLRMLADAQERNGWCVEFAPEPVTPTGIPGYVILNDRLVYREYVRVTDSSGCLVGSRPGTAWVPYSGGANAAGSNPFEKVETSARGRAIGAWGFGVLPGSGIATIEEMAGIAANLAAIAAENAATGDAPRQANDKPVEEIIEEIFAAAETLRQARGFDEDEMADRLALYVAKNLGLRQAVSPEGIIDWTRLKRAQAVLMLNNLRKAHQDHIAAGANL